MSLKCLEREKKAYWQKVENYCNDEPVLNLGGTLECSPLASQA
jgi:hypothetical protein